MWVFSVERCRNIICGICTQRGRSGPPHVDSRGQCGSAKCLKEVVSGRPYPANGRFDSAQSVVTRPAANTERQLAARRKGRCLLPVSAPILDDGSLGCVQRAWAAPRIITGFLCCVPAALISSDWLLAGIFKKRRKKKKRKERKLQVPFIFQVLFVCLRSTSWSKIAFRRLLF